MNGREWVVSVLLSERTSCSSSVSRHSGHSSRSLTVGMTFTHSGHGGHPQGHSQWAWWSLTVVMTVTVVMALTHSGHGGHPQWS